MDAAVTCISWNAFLHSIGVVPRIKNIRLLHYMQEADVFLLVLLYLAACFSCAWVNKEQKSIDQFLIKGGK